LSKLKQEGHSNGYIAHILGVDRSSVGRELKRNLTADGKYKPVVANNLACKRRCAAKKPYRLLEADRDLRERVEYLLHLEKKSPQAISMELGCISHEVIYRHAYRRYREEGVCLWQGLESQRRKRRPRKRREAEKRGKIKNTTHISQRPEDATARVVPGHYEGDTVHGCNSASLVTLNDPMTGYSYIRLTHNRTAETVVNAMMKAIRKDPKSYRSSMTLDNGKEFAAHENFSRRSGISTYFCDPHSPWQRGSNERRNRLIRKYFPKGTDFGKVSEKEVARVERIINNTCMKILGGITPAEARKRALLGIAIQH